MISQSSKSSGQAQLLERLRGRQAQIGIVGLGYVALSLTYAEVGYKVLVLTLIKSRQTQSI